MKRAWILPVCFMTAACGIAYQHQVMEKPRAEQFQLTNDERAGLQKAEALGPHFIVPKDAGADAWGRATAWVSRHASMKIQSANDYAIETFNPLQWGQFGYSISRAPIADGFDFDVRCVPGDHFKGYPSNPSGMPATGAVLEKVQKDCATNAAIASLFIKTGESPCERCIAQ